MGGETTRQQDQCCRPCDTLKFWCYGLRTESHRSLAPVFAAQGIDFAEEYDPGWMPDVRITVGDVPPFEASVSLNGISFHAAPGVMLLAVDGIARYREEDGCAIVVEPDPVASPERIGAFLFGSVFGALLHRRGIIPMHGSAVGTPGGECALIVGAPGAGKSTLTALLEERGRQVVADDVSALSSGSDGLVRLRPGPPRLKLSTEVLRRLGKDLDSLCGVGPLFDKFQLPTTQPVPGGQSFVVRWVFELTLGVCNRLMPPVQGLAKVRSLVKHTYRPRLVEILGDRKVYFERLSALARQVVFAELSRSDDLSEVHRLVDLVEAGMGLDGG